MSSAPVLTPGGGPPTGPEGAAAEAPIATIPGFRRAVAAGDLEGATTIATALDRADLREALRSLTATEIRSFYTTLGDDRLAALLRELESADAAIILQRLPEIEAADVLDEFAPDDAADVLEAIKLTMPALVKSLLVEMDRAGDIQALLRYLPDTAGGRMTTEFLAVKPTTTAAEVIQLLRDRAHDRPFRGYIYVTDDDRQLVGVVPLYELVVVEEPSTPVSEFMSHDVIRVVGSDDQIDVAAIFRQRHFMAVPVVDLEGRLMGVVTADDMADVMEREATKEMYRMAGIGVTERATSPLWESVRHRVPWLAFNMVWSFGAAIVINAFTGTIQAAAVLAIFIPVITGQAGNAGIQTATIVIRSLALGDVTPKDTFSVLLREWGVGFVKGALFGTILGLVAWLWQGNAVLGLIAGVSLFLNIAVVASTTGVLFPMALRRLGKDPATVAGVFDTMLSDLLGNLIYLGLATILLRFLV